MQTPNDESAITQEEASAIIEIIRTFPARFRALVENLDAETLTTAYKAGEWTIAQNVHHVFDSHNNSFTRMKYVLTEDTPTLVPYDQDVWAALPDSTTAELEPSLVAIEGIHARWAALLEAQPLESWSRTAHHPEIGTVTLGQLLRYYGNHGEAHITQINEVLAAR
jgi:uncharacterized damage-inducible protein DinB